MDFGFTVSNVPREPAEPEAFSAKKLNADIGEIARHAKVYLVTRAPIFKEEAYRLLELVQAYCARVGEQDKGAVLAINTLNSLPKFKEAMDRVFSDKPDLQGLEDMFSSFEIPPVEPEVTK